MIDKIYHLKSFSLQLSLTKDYPLNLKEPHPSSNSMTTKIHDLKTETVLNNTFWRPQS